MKRTGFYSAVALCLATALPILAAPPDNAITFGAAISITGKTAKEGEYTRDGYQFAIDRLNELGGVKVGGKTYKYALKYNDDETAVYFFKQPEGADEAGAAQRAMDICPTLAIGNDG